MTTREILPGEMVHHNDDFLYRDSYNQVWLVRRNSDAHLPLRIELFQKLTPPVTDTELFFRRVTSR